MVSFSNLIDFNSRSKKTSLKGRFLYNYLTDQSVYWDVQVPNSASPSLTD